MSLHQSASITVAKSRLHSEPLYERNRLSTTLESPVVAGRPIAFTINVNDVASDTRQGRVASR
jgi:hypothetical protein